MQQCHCKHDSMADDSRTHQCGQQNSEIYSYSAQSLMPKFHFARLDTTRHVFTDNVTRELGNNIWNMLLFSCDGSLVTYIYTDQL